MVEALYFSLAAIRASIFFFWRVFNPLPDNMERGIPSDRQPLLRSSVNEDASMANSDFTDSQTKAPGSITGGFFKYESRNRSVETETYPAKRFNGPSRGVGKNDWTQRGQNSFKATPQSIRLPGLDSPTEVIMELSQVCRRTHFSQTVNKAFEKSWIDKSKTSEFKMLYLFDIKIVPSRLHGQTPSIGEPSSHDRQLLSLLADFPLRFYGVSRACHIGDRDHPKKLCGNDNCGICSVFKAQWKARRDNTPFESGPRIRASPQSSQADKYVTNDHFRSQQHAMILCACPGLGQSKSQNHRSNAIHTYPSSTSSMKAILPIGLIMYARKGWNPSASTSSLSG
ncbi:hypothetical protein N7488_003306 [Penicillium malachiteum]|nr:hypothetical protein N7488_003306 [Penicillium malachiteum]